MTPLEAAAYFVSALLLIGGWLAVELSWEMRMTRKRDEVLDEIDATALELLRLVPNDKYVEASIRYNHLRRLSRAIRHNRPPLPPRTYSYKPELRAGK